MTKHNLALTLALFVMFPHSLCFHLFFFFLLPQLSRCHIELLFKKKASFETRLQLHLHPLLCVRAAKKEKAVNVGHTELMFVSELLKINLVGIPLTELIECTECIAQNPAPGNYRWSFTSDRPPNRVIWLTPLRAICLGD